MRYYYKLEAHSRQNVFQTHQVCLVSEDMLEATKSQLDPVTSVHLYSVQKGKPKVKLNYSQAISNP